MISGVSSSCNTCSASTVGRSSRSNLRADTHNRIRTSEVLSGKELHCYTITHISFTYNVLQSGIFYTIIIVCNTLTSSWKVPGSRVISLLSLNETTPSSIHGQQRTRSELVTILCTVQLVLNIHINSLPIGQPH